MSFTTIEILPVRTIMRSSGTVDNVVNGAYSDEADPTAIEGAGTVSLPGTTDAVTGGEMTCPVLLSSFVLLLLQAAAVAMTSTAAATINIFFN
jgi:hypothetical protein